VNISPRFPETVDWLRRCCVGCHWQTRLTVLLGYLLDPVKGGKKILLSIFAYLNELTVYKAVTYSSQTSPHLGDSF